MSPLTRIRSVCCRGTVRGSTVGDTGRNLNRKVLWIWNLKKEKMFEMQRWGGFLVGVTVRAKAGRFGLGRPVLSQQTLLEHLPL